MKDSSLKFVVSSRGQRVRAQLDFPDYYANVLTAPDVSLLVLCKTYGYARYYFAVKNGENILGALPLLYVKSLIFGKRLISLPFVEYAVPVLKNGLSSSVVRLVLKLLVDYAESLMRKLKGRLT